MSLSTAALEALASLEEAKRPWSPFIGLVRLEPSRYCQIGVCYAIDASRAGFPELGQAAVIHQDDVEPFRTALAKVLDRTLISDAELAAWIFWTSMRVRGQR